MTSFSPDTSTSEEDDGLLSAYEQELEWRKCSRDPKHFLTKYAKTADPLDKERPNKPFPDIPYLWWLLDYLQIEPLVAIPKSRRVLATWLVTGLNVWECLFLRSRKVGIGNEDQTKARENLEMHRTIYDQLPEWMKQRGEMRWAKDKMSFPTSGSEIIAFEQNPDVFRMFTFSRIWIDEAQAQRYPGEMYLGAMPTIRGRSLEHRGQLIYTGTPAQGWFELLCHDQLESEEPPPPAWVKQLVTDWKPDDPNKKAWGVEVARLSVSGFLRIQIHYTADPEKRTAAWFNFTRKGIPQEDWDQDYELNWKSKAGKPAIPQIRHGTGSRRHEIVVQHFTPPDHWVRFSTHDYGTTNPYSCHFHALAPDGTGYTYWEYYARGPLGVHLDAIKSHPDFPRLRVKILDRSCWANTQQATDSLEGRTMHQLRSVAELHANHGVYCIPAAVVQDRVKIARVEEVWPPLEMRKEGEIWVPLPAQRQIRWFVMDNCAHLLRECEGIVWEKLSYAQKLKKNDPEKLVDRDNHAFDEWTYGLLHLGSPDLEITQVVLTPEQARDAQRIALQVAHVERAEAETEDQYDDEDGWLDD